MQVAARTTSGYHLWAALLVHFMFHFWNSLCHRRSAHIATLSSGKLAFPINADILEVSVMLNRLVLEGPVGRIREQGFPRPQLPSHRDDWVELAGLASSYLPNDLTRQPSVHGIIIIFISIKMAWRRLKSPVRAIGFCYDDNNCFFAELVTRTISTRFVLVAIKEHAAVMTSGRFAAS